MGILLFHCDATSSSRSAPILGNQCIFAALSLWAPKSLLLRSLTSFFILLFYNRLNRLEKAVSAYSDALRIDPFFVEAYNGRGNALMDFGHEDGTVLGRQVQEADHECSTYPAFRTTVVFQPTRDCTFSGCFTRQGPRYHRLLFRYQSYSCLLRMLQA